MAHKSLAKLSLLFLLPIFILSQSDGAKLRQTTMTMYLQDKSGGNNPTVVTVTGIPGRVWSFSSFGTVYIGDDPVTQGPEGTSPEIARIQGVFAVSALDGSINHVSASIVFTNKEYGGSTIEIQGASRWEEIVREVAVVGGTGKFRFARGFATFETLYYDLETVYCLIRCNVTVQHY